MEHISQIDSPLPQYLRFDEKELPEILNWNVGEEYELTLKVKQTSKEMYLSVPSIASFEVLSAESKKKRSL